MKSLQFDEITLQYEVYDLTPELSSYNPETRFYSGFREVKCKKYWFFGEVIIKKVPIFLFSIPKDITDPSLSKNWWQTAIASELDKIKARQKREEEIKNGELI